MKRRVTMKAKPIYYWLALLVVLAVVLGTALAQEDLPEAVAEEGPEITAPAPPPGPPPDVVPPGAGLPPGGRRGGGAWRLPAMEGMLGPLWLESRDPELFKLVTDIALLRQINAAALSPDQIKQVLPALNELIAAQKQARAKAKATLLKEREE